jgi:plastocyanin
VNKAALLVVPLLLVSCSGSKKSTGSATTSGAPDAQTVTVEMKNDLKFHPDTVDARVGTVSFDVVNVETVPHDMTFEGQVTATTGNVDGKTHKILKVVFSKPGTFSFICTVHPGMDGKVVVS